MISYVLCAVPNTNSTRVETIDFVFWNRKYLALNSAAETGVRKNEFEIQFGGIFCKMLTGKNVANEKLIFRQPK